MSRHLILIAILLLMLGIIPLSAQDDTSSVGVMLLDTETIELTSSINGEDYVIWVGLPTNYALLKENLPVLYLLDPDFTFGMAVNYLRLSTYRSSDIPQVIIVGIAYPTSDTGRYLNFRERDYDTQADEFRDFFSEDLIPLINSTYRTNPDDRTIYGHSRGGLFVLDTLATRPELFNRYISTSPNWSESLGSILEGDDEAFRDGIAGRNIKFFLAAGGEEVAITSNIMLIKEKLDMNNYEGLEITAMAFDDEDHLSVVPAALARGLRVVFWD